MPLPQPAMASSSQANEIVSLKAQLNQNIKKAEDFQV